MLVDDGAEDRIVGLKGQRTGNPADIDAGHVQMLVIIGESNPAFTAPADLKFAEAMRKVNLVVHSGLFFDETARLSHWHVPAAHYLEAWSDARAFDGTVTIQQPQVRPLSCVFCQDLFHP